MNPGWRTIGQGGLEELSGTRLFWANPCSRRLYYVLEPTMHRVGTCLGWKLRSELKSRVFEALLGKPQLPSNARTKIHTHNTNPGSR